MILKKYSGPFDPLFVCVWKCINLGSLVCRYYLLAVTSIWAETAETYQIQPRASRDPLTNITVLLSSIGCWMLTYSEHYCNVSQTLPTKPQNAVTWDRPLLTCWTWRGLMHLKIFHMHEEKHTYRTWSHSWTETTWCSHTLMLSPRALFDLNSDKRVLFGFYSILTSKP